MTKLKLYLLLAVFLSAAGCTGRSTPTVAVPIPDISHPSEPVPSPSPNVTVEATATLPAPTSIPTTTPTPTLRPTYTLTPITLPIRSASQKCLTVEPDLPQGFLSTGEILFSDEAEQAPVRFGILVINGQNLQPLLLPNAPQLFDNSVTSPDGKWLAYHHVLYENGNFNRIDDRLIVINALGQAQASMNWDEDWFTIVGWLDAERLVLRKFDSSWRGVYIVNPFTGENQQFIPTLPDFFRSPEDDKMGLWEIIVDPSLSRVAYTRREDEQWPPKFVLWDLQNGRDVWVLNKDARFDWPVWSPDGSRLAIIVQDRPEDDWDRFELFITDWDGNAKEWVDLRGNADIGLGGEMSWSPDGRYLAISGKPLVILDMATQQVWDTCRSGGDYEIGRRSLFWSPDSKQLLVTYDHEPGIVIDIEQGIAAQIGQASLLVPVGWLVESP